MEKDGVIERVCHLNWATGIVVVRKPTGKVRICGDASEILDKQDEINTKYSLSC